MNKEQLRADIIEDLEEKINEIYLKYQRQLYIESGDIAPVHAVNQDDCICRLSRIITEVLVFEMG